MNKLINFFTRLDNIPKGVAVIAAGFLPVFAIVSMFPALPAILDHFQSHPESRTLVPLMISAPGLAIACTASLAGFLIDKYGRVGPLRIAVFMYGVIGCVPLVLDDIYLIIASRFLLGFCEAVIITSANTLIGDYWDDKGRRDWLFIQGMLGPVLSALVIRLAGPAADIQWNGVFVIYSLAFIVFLIVLLFMKEPERVKEIISPTAQAIKKKPFPMISILLVGSVTLFASVLYYTTIISGSLVFRELGIMEPSRISELSALPSLFVVLGALIFRLLGKQSNAVQLGTFFIIMCTGMITMGFATSATMLVIGMIIQQTGAGMSVPSLIAWTQNKFSDEHRGRSMGIWSSCFFFGQFTSPLLVAQLERVTGTVQNVFVAAGYAGISVAIIVMLWQLRLVIFNKVSASHTN